MLVASVVGGVGLAVEVGQADRGSGRPWVGPPADGRSGARRPGARGAPDPAVGHPWCDRRAHERGVDGPLGRRQYCAGLWQDSPARFGGPLAFVWSYDERCRLIGEHVYEDSASREITRPGPADVITVERAAQLLLAPEIEKVLPRVSHAPPDRCAAVILREIHEHLAGYAEDGQNGRLFIGPRGATPRRSAFNRIWKRSLKAAHANPGLHLHDLRHTGGTLTAQAGATVKEIMSRIGRGSTRPATIYQHATSERDRKIAEALDMMIREARAAGEEAALEDPPPE